MFFEGERITAMREMIVARDVAGRRRALAKLLPMQRSDFEAIFEAMDGCPVTIRLLDPPLHEFLPHGGEESRHLAETLQLSREDLGRIVDGLREVNPMLGHRGLPAGHHLSGDHRDAGAGDLRGVGPRLPPRHRRPAGDHDPARRRLSESLRISARSSRE